MWLPSDIARGRQDRGGTAVTGSAFALGAALTLAALFFLICPIFAGSPSSRKTTAAPVPHVNPDAQHGAGASFYDQPAEAEGD